MSKLTRKCPNCGATVPADVKYCRKCHARMDTGRVEVLSNAEKEQRPKKRNKDNDALRNLPRPVRPVEGDEAAYPQQERRPVQQRDQNGFFTPGQGDELPRKRPVRRPAPGAEGVPQPVSTARGADGAPMEPKKNSDKNLWQIITVLAIIFVIIVVAIVLVIRLNRPAGNTTPSDPYENANVITSSTEKPAPSPSATPAAANTPQASPQGLIVPQATPIPSPTPTPPVVITPTPSPTPAAGNNAVTPVNDTVYINGTGVNIRSGPGTDHSIIGSENTGKQLQRTGKTSNGWSQVAYNGQTGYVIDSLLTTTQPAASNNNNTNSNVNVTEASGTVRVAAASGANLRTGPDTSYSIVTTVPANTELTRTGTSGSWTRVSYNGQNVYISTSLLASDSSGSTGNTGSTTGTTTSSGTGTVRTSSGGPVNVRAGAGTGYNVIGSASSGSTVTITGETNGWYQINYNGQTGYISSQYVVKN